MKHFIKSLFLVAAFAATSVTAFAGVDPDAALLSIATVDDLASGVMFAGLLVNKAALDGAFFAIKTMFNNAFSAVEVTWQQTAMLVPSTSSEERYEWLNAFPKMRKWIGDKHIKALEAQGYSVVNDDFEATVEVDRNDIDDDKLGIYRPQAEMAGFSAAQLPDEIVTELKDNAFVKAGFDGQFFYDTDHPRGASGAVQSNKSTIALSSATRAAAEASYGAARTAMMTLLDEEGRPLGLRPDVLEVPPTLETAGRILVEGDKLDDDTPNPFKGTARLVVNERLVSQTQWMLHDTRMPVKPFIYQERKAPVFVQQTDPETDGVFLRKKFLFGAEARAAGGYGLWQLSHGSDGTS